MMPKKYEVAFVVYADIPEKDSSIGDLECNGTLRSYDWCFDTSKYGGFMDSYNTAIVVWGKADDIDETDY